MSKEQKYWFKRRRYGYGWLPVTKEGFIAFAIYIGLLLVATFTLPQEDSNEFTAEVGYYLLFVFILTAGFIRLCYKKGPRPKWRWGAKPDDNPEEDA